MSNFRKFLKKIFRNISFNIAIIFAILKYSGLPNYYIHFVFVSWVKSPKNDNTNIKIVS